MDGSRIRIAVNHKSNACAVKLVDNSKIGQKHKNENYKTNEQFVEGLERVVNILRAFMISYEY